MGEQWLGYIVRFPRHQKLPPRYEVEGISAPDETGRVRTQCYYWHQRRTDECGPDVIDRWAAWRGAWAHHRTGEGGDPDYPPRDEA